MRTLLFLAILLFMAACQSGDPIQLSGRTMGTIYNISILPADDQKIETHSLQQNIDTLLAEVNQQMSTYVKHSEISQFNHLQSTEPFNVSEPFTKVLRLALQIYRESEGAFDVTVAPLVNLWGFGTKGRRDYLPTDKEVERVLKNIGSNHISVLNDTTIQKFNPNISLDFGAIAKGYGVDAVSDLLYLKGYRNYLVEIGGEIVVRGTKNGQPWKIGIDRPVAGAQPGADLQYILELTDIAMATSGDYRNYFTVGDSSYSHEINPRTGQSIITGVASVTVLAPSCMLADAMATSIMVMGAETGLTWVESKPEIEALIITHDKNDFKTMSSLNFMRYVKK